MGDIYSEMNDLVPQYMEKLCTKYKMKCQRISDLETAMYNEKCCLVIGVDRFDAGVEVVVREDGMTKEYSCRNYFAKKYDATDRVNLITDPNDMTKDIKNCLIIMANGLDSKWGAVLEGDMSWFEDYKQSKWYFESKCFVEERNELLNAVLDSMEETSPTK